MLSSQSMGLNHFLIPDVVLIVSEPIYSHIDPLDFTLTGLENPMVFLG